LKYLACRFNYKFGRHLNLKKPVDVTLELSSFCNQQCQYCYHAENKPPFTKGLMSEQTAFAILDQAAKLGVPSIKLNWRGESHLNPNFESITKHAKKLGFIDRISNSNFNFSPSREDIFRAFCNQTTVKISFDSFNTDVFLAQRKGADVDRILENIDKFYHYRGRKNKIIIQMVRTEANKDENFEKNVKTLWPDALVSVRNVVPNRVVGGDAFSGRSLEAEERQPCYQAYARLIFDYAGNATCCCPDIKNEFNFGNINRESLLEIWNDENLLKLREMLRNRMAFNISPCSTCSSLESYKGYKHNWNS